MNRVTISGNLTKDIELRKTKTGKSYCSFALGVNERDSTTFVNCKAWEHQADFLDSYAKKGDKVLVDGRLEVSTYEDDEGNARTWTAVVANSVECWTRQTLEGAKKTAKKKSRREDYDYE